MATEALDRVKQQAMVLEAPGRLNTGLLVGSTSEAT